MRGTNLENAFSKLVFCFRISSGYRSFLSLVRNTKKFSHYYKSHPEGPDVRMGDESCYKLNLPGGKHKVYLRTRMGDIGMFYELFWQRVYSIRLDHRNRKLIIVDAGAHIGMASLYFLENYDTETIYCIEPDPANLRLLRKNLSAEITGGKVMVIECAISAREGTAILDNSGWSYNSRLTSVDPSTSHKSYKPVTSETISSEPVSFNSPTEPASFNSPAEAASSQITSSGSVASGSVASGSPISFQTVPTKTIKNIIIENKIEHIDLMKIDIEGAESYLFADGADWLNRVDNILIEIHKEELKDHIRKTLNRYGFSFEKWNRNQHGNVYLATNNRS